jgi:YggT family protein
MGAEPEPDRPMKPLVIALIYVLNFYWWIVVASAIFSWLYAFNVVNTRNQVVSSIGEFLYRATEPVYRPIRKVLPTLGGLDLSPLVVLLAIVVLEQYLQFYLLPIVP